MEALIWIGAALTLIGVLGLGWCVLIAVRARREGLDEDAMRERLQRVVAINFAALGISAIGLMTVVLGLFLS
ncbi:MAG: hypothetical protein QNJ35_10740 [Paracoccaceae bacterium]|nr:hypothetical protein [Paracoccaceae bacterium]